MIYKSVIENKPCTSMKSLSQVKEKDIKKVQKDMKKEDELLPISAEFLFLFHTEPVKTTVQEIVSTVSSKAASDSLTILILWYVSLHNLL